MKLSQPLIRSFISTVAVALIRAGCQYARKESVRKFEKWRRLQNLRRTRGLPRRTRSRTSCILADDHRIAIV
jgi:hypothetical protein